MDKRNKHLLYVQPAASLPTRLFSTLSLPPNPRLAQGQLALRLSSPEWGGLALDRLSMRTAAAMVGEAGRGEGETTRTVAGCCLLFCP
jgi:hypothetical protein